MTLALIPVILVGAFSLLCLAAYGHPWPLVVSVTWAAVAGIRRWMK